MKRFTFSKAASALVLTTVLGACDDGLTEVNQNPNGPEDVSAQVLLTQAITSSVGRALGASVHMDWTAVLVQHHAEIQYAEEDLYQFRDGTINTHWAGFYSGPLEDLHQIIQKGEASNQPNVTATGLIMKSWTFQIMTDLWGDIPYSEALRGQDEEGITTPVYDSQEAIYDGMLADLATANGMIDAGTNPWGSADLIYGGDMAKWKLFANSLRLRMAMRMSEADPTEAQAEFAAALADGVFESNADIAQLVYGAAPDNNPINENQQSRDDHAISATMVEALKERSDPRLAVYAEQTAAGSYNGMPNGIAENPFPFETISRLGSYFTAPDAPAVLMSYSEVLFLQAEAAARGWIAGDPASLYNQAIRADMEVYGISDAEITAYLAQPDVAYNAANGLKMIAVQKWISLFGQGPEAWAEWRRTGYPELTAGPDADNGGVIPVRIAYASDEQSYNNAQLQEAMSRSGSGLNASVWWDQ